MSLSESAPSPMPKMQMSDADPMVVHEEQKYVVSLDAQLRLLEAILQKDLHNYFEAEGRMKQFIHASCMADGLVSVHERLLYLVHLELEVDGAVGSGYLQEEKSSQKRTIDIQKLRLKLGRRADQAASAEERAECTRYFAARISDPPSREFSEYVYEHDLPVD